MSRTTAAFVVQLVRQPKAPVASFLRAAGRCAAVPRVDTVTMHRLRQLRDELLCSTTTTEPSTIPAFELLSRSLVHHHHHTTGVTSVTRTNILTQARAASDTQTDDCASVLCRGTPQLGHTPCHTPHPRPARGRRAPAARKEFTATRDTDATHHSALTSYQGAGA